MASIQGSVFVAFVTFGSVAGCATATAPPARSAEPRGIDRSQAPRPLARADELYHDPVATHERESSSSTQHQVAELRRAIALHLQFIDRAEDDAHYAEAVKRSQDRIEDARATIEFLLAEPSPAP